jgi:hypothetical protein
MASDAIGYPMTHRRASDAVLTGIHSLNCHDSRHVHRHNLLPVFDDDADLGDESGVQLSHSRLWRISYLRGWSQPAMRPEDGSRRAWVTLLTRPSYLPGVLVLHYSLQRVKSAYPLIVLITPTLPSSSVAAMRALGIQVEQVEPLRPLVPVSIVAERFADTWDKLRAFGLDLDRAVMIDGDMLLLQNMDDLFDMELPADGTGIAANHGKYDAGLGARFHASTAFQPAFATGRAMHGRRMSGGLGRAVSPMHRLMECLQPRLHQAHHIHTHFSTLAWSSSHRRLRWARRSKLTCTTRRSSRHSLSRTRICSVYTLLASGRRSRGT